MSLYIGNLSLIGKSIEASGSQLFKTRNASNRPKWLWDWFRPTVKFWGDYSVCVSTNMKAISWRAQKLNQQDTKGKQFNITRFGNVLSN